MVRSGGDINTTGYSNPAADELIDQARTETDETSRFDLYKQLRQIVFDDSPVIFVHYETIDYLMQKDVVGFDGEPDPRVADAGRGVHGREQLVGEARITYSDVR